VGGGGERVTLKLVARYADGCNFGGDAAAIRHKLEVLERHCEAVGRDSAEITKSTSVEGVIFGDEREVARQIGARSRAIGVDPDVLRAQLGPLAGPAEQVAEELRARVAAGIDYVIVFLAGLAEGGQLQRFADEVIPLVG
jgi:alkanesulfonate monooxygenase SsuD/methylene tetrahydromethanopterin reductase-like flavin-dependent oxidoreductase (luciferase family)